MNRLLPFALLISTTGCFFYADPGPPAPTHGDISFFWEFEGEPDCTAAGVRELDVVVADASGEAVFTTTELCVGGGLTLRDFREGDYLVLLDAYGPRDERLYTGEIAVFVEAGVDNDVGVIDLQAVAGASATPPVTAWTGGVSLYWGFVYPAMESYVTACSFAGAVEVDVFVDPLFAGADGFAGTFDCRDAGVVVEDLIEGPYAVRLVSYGRYRGADLALYDSGDFEVFVPSGAVVELGDVALPRVEENFSDIDVGWSSPAGSCGQLGIGDVEVEVVRVGGDGAPDDAFVVDCGALAVLRTTFVPGTYEVTAWASGAYEDYLGVATVDVPPGLTAPVDLDLLPIR